MRKKFLPIIILFIAVLFFACSKEYSYESGNGFGGTATGTLKDSSGNCQSIVVKGNYIVDTVMTDSNYVVVKFTVATVGTYKITTDTVNGFWFNDSAYVLTTGTQNIKLKAHGKPILPINSMFTVKYGTSFCTFSIAVAGSGGLTSDYFPTTANSNWTYKNSASSDTFRVTATNTTYLIGSNVYTLFVDTYSDSSVYRKDGVGNYYTYSALDDSSSRVVYIFLKDNVANGTTWESPEANTTFLGASSKLKYRYTMTNNSTSLTINGTTYNNVLKVRLDFYYFVSGAYQTSPAYSQYDYYAQGVGLINSETINFTPTIYQPLQRYKVY